MVTYDFEVTADYHQFYLMDDEKQPLIPDDVTNEDVRRRVKVAPHIFVVYTVRDSTVPVTIVVHDSEPPTDLAAYDHIAECTLLVPSGRIVVAGCTDYLPDCTRLQLIPGTYRARVLYGDLGTSVEGNLQADDHYQISLWPARAGALQIIKQYDEPPT